MRSGFLLSSGPLLPCRPVEVSIGLDVGGTKCLGVAVSADGRVLAEDRSATPDDGPALVDALAGAAGRLLDEVGAPAGPSLRSAQPSRSARPPWP